MKHLFIINTQTLSTIRKQLIKNIQEHFIDFDYTIEYTGYIGHATKIAKKYVQTCPQLRIYSCGGDGTLHEIINGIYPAKHVELAIIPIGTGNDFVKSLGLAKSDFLDLKKYKQPKLIWSDLLCTNDEVSINTVSLGFDVRIAANVAKFKHLPIPKGTVPYYLSLLYCMFSSLTEKFQLAIENQKLPEKSYTFVVFANGQYYGGGYRPCPSACINDALIDICLISKVPRRLILKLAGKYKKGEHLTYTQYVSTHQAKKIHILDEHPVMICLDGEIRMMYQPCIEVLPQQIQICLPETYNI